MDAVKTEDGRYVVMDGENEIEIPVTEITPEEGQTHHYIAEGVEGQRLCLWNSMMIS